MPNKSRRTRSGARRVWGLRLRLVSFCVVIAAISIAVTAWIAIISTSSSINEQYTQNVSSVAAVYDQLSGYAATHDSWDGVTRIVTHLARTDHTRITLTRDSGSVIVDSSRGNPLLAGARPAASINPLQPDTLVGDIPLVIGVDARATGPYTLTAAQQATIRKDVQVVRSCYQEKAFLTLAVKKLSNGRSYLPDATDNRVCPQSNVITEVTPAEQLAGRQLTALVARCFPMGDRLPQDQLLVRMPNQKLVLDPASPSFLGTFDMLFADTSGSSRACVANAWRTQLAPYVTPPAELYLSISVASTRPGLSGIGLHRIELAGALILVIVLLICFVAASRLRRPLAALTYAVARTAAGERSNDVALQGTREMRELAVAVNNMAVQLDEAEQGRQDMVSDVAHELRTPLGNIRGWLEAVQDSVAHPDTALIARLLGEAMLLQRLIDDLQDLALADAGQLTIHPELVDVAAVAEQVVAGASVALLPPTESSASLPSITVRFEASGDTLLVADPVRVRQILGNLVSNALRATTGGVITVTVTGRPDAILLEVADTGLGIAAEDLPHLFDRFWRADKSRSRSRGGSGLGLAITQAMVHAHEGHIDVRSRPASGTKVTVTLPRESRTDRAGLT